ncbi:hypothetical protein HDE_12672 [Halotydeus destructor]|nr:hypothetical protein HDE_12672 [Halotydeus destructor]
MDGGTVDFETLKEAAVIISQGFLKENADDTLSEQYITLVEKLLEHGHFSDEMFISLLEVAVDSLAEDDAGDYRSYALRLIGLILSKESIFAMKISTVDQAKECTAKYLESLCDRSTTYLIQIGIAQCLSTISNHLPGYTWCVGLEEQSGVYCLSSLHDVLRSTKSFFVKSAIERFFLQIAKQFSKYGNLTNQLLSSLISQITSDKTADNFHLSMTALTSGPDPEANIEHFLQEGNLKALIKLTNLLFANVPSHFNLWFSVVAATLAFDRTWSEKQTRDKLRWPTLTSENYESLKRISLHVDCDYKMAALHGIATLVSNFDDSQLAQIVLLLNRTLLAELDNCVSKGKNIRKQDMKYCNELILVLEKVIGPYAKQNHVECNVLAKLFIYTDKGMHQDLRRNLLKCFRVFFENLPRDLTNSAADMDEFVIPFGYLVERLYEERSVDYDEVAYNQSLNVVLEIMAILPQIKPSVYSLTRIEERFWYLWSVFKKNPRFDELAAPVIISFLPMDSKSDAPELTKLCDSLQTFFNPEKPSLALSATKALAESKTNMDRLMAFEERCSQMFWSVLAPSLSKLARDPTDSDLQSLSLRVWLKILISVENALENESDVEERIQQLLGSGLLDSLYLIALDGLNGFSDVPKLCEDNWNKLRDILSRRVEYANLLIEKSNYDKETNPKQSNLGIGAGSEKQNRELIIEDMFNGYVNQPTLDLIENLNNRPKTDEQGETTHLKSVDASQLIEFLFAPTFKAYFELEKPNYHCMLLKGIMEAKDLEKLLKADRAESSDDDDTSLNQDLGYGHDMDCYDG